MSLAAPHYLLHSETAAANGPTGRWRFVLQQPAGQTALEADDEEPATSPERLELLAIIRGLEALDQPSRVTLVSASRNVQSGLRFGLANWRASDWQWERYGQLTAVKNADLWQRLDRLLDIHRVDCRGARSKPADDLAAPAVQPQRQDPGSRRLRFDAAEGKSSEPTNKKTKTDSQNTIARLGSSVRRFFGF